MATIKRFEEIEAWREARKAVKEIYGMTSVAPISSDYDYRNQIRSSAVAVMSNIAEGFSRDGDRDFARFLDIAKSSAMETESLLYVGLDVGYLSEERFRELFEKYEAIVKQISRFASYLRGRRK